MVPVVTELHDDALAGHFGIAKTLELISRSYWWPQPWKLVINFVKTCARAKAVHHRPYGLLQPLAIPNRPMGLHLDGFCHRPPRH